MSATPPEALNPGSGPHAPAAAEQLRDELETLGIHADVHEGYGMALVSVWVGLVVWCDGERYWWRTGWDAQRRRVLYAWHSAVEPARAARRVALRYADLRANHPLSEVIADVTSGAGAAAVDGAR
ncbi:hypothetical protein AB0L53_14425 [Nonomuraea sp. NPDC052129]|uniref:hypothetical protein n=1 Tax=Nonomuraea sp. NPDC052129 TaxID=3154651 RepID=UPI003437FE4E